MQGGDRAGRYRCSSLMKVGERALAMARVYNHREGFTAADDKPLWRISTKFESGPAEGVEVPMEDIARAPSSSTTR